MTKDGAERGAEAGANNFQLNHKERKNTKAHEGRQNACIHNGDDPF